VHIFIIFGYKLLYNKKKHSYCSETRMTGITVPGMVPLLQKYFTRTYNLYSSSNRISHMQIDTAHMDNADEVWPEVIQPFWRQYCFKLEHLRHFEVELKSWNVQMCLVFKVLSRCLSDIYTKYFAAGSYWLEKFVKTVSLFQSDKAYFVTTVLLAQSVSCRWTL